MARPWPGRGRGHEGNGAGLLPGAVVEGPLGVLLRPQGAPGEKDLGSSGGIRVSRGAAAGDGGAPDSGRD